jgi:hypothetical protein
MSAPRWGNLNDLVAVSGLARRTLQYMAKQEPGVLITRERAGKTQYDLGGCNVNLRKRDVEKALAAAAKKDDGGDGDSGESRSSAERRKAIAEAGIAEIKLAEAQKAVIPLGDHLREIEDILLHLRAGLIANPKTREHAPQLLAALRSEPPPPIDEPVEESDDEAAA